MCIAILVLLTTITYARFLPIHAARSVVNVKMPVYTSDLYGNVNIIVNIPHQSSTHLDSVHTSVCTIK